MSARKLSQTQTKTHTELGQRDSGSSKPAVTCRARCSGKPLLMATIDDLIKLSLRRPAARAEVVMLVFVNMVCVCVEE